MKDTIEQLFSSRTRVKLLRLFFTHPDVKFFVRQLTRETGEHINSIRRELNNLVNVGLLQTNSAERKKYYSVNTNHLLYMELKALVLKSYLYLERKFISKLQQMPKVLYLSLLGYFTGDQLSAIDIFIIGELSKESLQQLLEEFNQRFNQKLRYTKMNKAEYEYRYTVTDKFLFTILNSNQIILINKLTLPAKRSSVAKI